MAKFNPDIPSTAPPPESYLNATRPLSPWDIGVNRTAQVTLTGIGDTLKTAITGADEVMRSMIDTGLRTDLTAKRDEATAGLEQIAGIPSNLSVSQPVDNTPAPDDSPKLIPGATAAPLPAGLQTLDRTLQGPATGLATKPQMQSLYDARLDMIAKDYRSKYPGYADYIDQRVAAITGGNPANKYVEDLMSMIKQTQGNVLKEHNEAIAFVGAHEKYPGAAQVVANIASGNIPGGLSPMTYAVKWASPYSNADYQTQSAIQENSKWQGDQGVLKDKNIMSATDMATKVSNGVFTQMIDSANMSPKDLEDRITKYRTGALPLPDSATLDQYGQVAEAAGMSAWNQVKKRLDTPGPDGRSQAAIIGQAAVDQLKTKVLEPYTTIANQFRSKDVGLAFDSTRYNLLAGADTNKWLLDKSPAANFFRLQRAVVANGGPAAQGIMSSALLSGKYGTMDDVLKGYGQYRTAEAAAEPGHPLASTLDDLAQRGVGGPGKEAQRDLYKYFTTDVPALIANPKLDATSKTNLIQNLFAGDVVSKFDDDSKHTVIQNMTRPDIADSIWKISGNNATNPLWLQYKNWVTSQTSNLLTQDIKNVNELQDKGNASFTWDPKTSSVVGAPGTDQTYVHFWDTPTNVIRKGQVSTLQSTLNNVNTSLQPLVAIAKKEGLDPNQFVANQLNNMGIDPSSKLMQSITGSTGSNTAETAPAKPVTKTSPDTPVSDFLLNLPDHVKNVLSPYIDSAGKAAQDLIHSGKTATLEPSPGANPDLKDVDPRLLDVVAAGATHLPAGYKVTINDGFNEHGHVAGSQHHVKGSGALDVQIWDPQGNKIPNKGKDSTGLYAMLGHGAYAEMLAKYPELKGKLAHGSAFGTVSGGNVPDLMHFDLGGERGYLGPTISKEGLRTTQK